MTFAHYAEIDELRRRGQLVARTLRYEGREAEAATVTALVVALDADHYLTVPQVAERFNTPRRLLEKAAEKGAIDSVVVDGVYLIATSSLADIERTLAISADLPIPTATELETALAPERKLWTWVGKES